MITIKDVRLPPDRESSCLCASSYRDHKILMLALKSKYLPNISMKTEEKQEHSVLANMANNIHQCRKNVTQLLLENTILSESYRLLLNINSLVSLSGRFKDDCSLDGCSTLFHHAFTDFCF